MDSELENKKFAEEEARLEKRKENDLKFILQHPQGRRFLWEALSDAGIFCGSFSANALLTAFTEGRRDLGLKLLERLNRADRNAFSKLQNEFFSEAMKTAQPAKPKA